MLKSFIHNRRVVSDSLTFLYAVNIYVYDVKIVAILVMIRAQRGQPTLRPNQLFNL